MPSSSRLLTSSAILSWTAFMLDWYGSSVTTICSPPRVSSISARARTLIEPRPGAVGVHDAGPAEDEGARGEVRALDEVHQVVGRGVRMVDQVDGGVDHLAQVVGRDVGGHADGDPLAAVDQQVGEPGGEDGRLLLLVGVVGDPVDGVLVDALEHVHGEQAQPAFGVALGRRGEVGRAVVAVEVDQGMAQAEGLGHADQGVVDGLVAVRVKPAHGVAADLGALHVRTIGPVALDVHVVENAPVHRLEAVPGVGEGPADDDRHGVVQEGPLHLVLDLDRLDGAVGQARVPGAVVASPSPPGGSGGSVIDIRYPGTGRRRRWS